MSPQPPSRETIEAAFKVISKHKNIARAADEMGMRRTTLNGWVEYGIKQYGLAPPEKTHRSTPTTPPKGRLELSVGTGTVLIGADFHFWPGEPSTAHRAFVAFHERYRKSNSRPLRASILNGDVCDFSGISRHPPIGWKSLPTTEQEIECAQDRLHEIEKAAGKGVEKLWTAGNHDLRMETWLASKAPELKGIKGTSLADHFPNWRPCWSVHINGEVVVKHRGRGGIHATWNNVINAGMTIVTAHCHSQTVRAFTDFRGTRWGVDTGCIADVYAEAFQDYLEDGFRNWRSGFGVLTFVDGELLPPELVTVIRPGVVWFRGELIEV